MGDFIYGQAGTDSIADRAVTFVKTNQLASRYSLVERFKRRPQLNASIGVATNLDFEIQGTNAANLGCLLDTDGGVSMATTLVGGDQLIVAPHLDTEQTAWTDTSWSTSDSLLWEALIQTAANIDDIVIWAGLKLTNTSVVATDNDQAFFRFSRAAVAVPWHTIYSIGGTDTDSTISTYPNVAASTIYALRIEIDVNRIATFYINNTLVTTSTALTDTINLIPFVGVQTAAAAAKTIYLRGQTLSRLL